MEKYSEDKALEEASKMREKIESGEAKDYDEAEKIINEEVIPGVGTKDSVFNECVLSRGRDDLVVDEKEKSLLLDKIKLIASRVEILLKLQSVEELKWDIDFIAPLNEEDIQAFKERAAQKAEQQTYDFLRNDEEREKKFGPEFAGDFNNFPRQERFEKLKPKVLEYLLTNTSWDFVQSWDFVLRANITVARKNKSGKSDSAPYYANINLFGDKIIQKIKGEMTADELVKDIVAKLENK